MLILLPAFLTAAGLSYIQGRYKDVRESVNAWLPSHDDAFGRFEVAPEMPVSLPALPYAIDALEPDISEDTLKHHHGTHEQRYLRRTWGILEMSPAQRTSQDWSDLAYNANAVLLHELYWASMKPMERNTPVPMVIERRIRKDFGSMDRLQAELFAVAKGLRGSGWVMLAWSPSLNRLVLLPIRNHNEGGLLGSIPLVVLDVWEHAWYLDRASDQDEYLRAFWRRIDWDQARKRLTKALRVTDPTLGSLIA